MSLAESVIWICGEGTEISDFCHRNLGAEFDIEVPLDADALFKNLVQLNRVPHLLIIDADSLCGREIEILVKLKLNPAWSFPRIVISSEKEEQVLRRYFLEGAGDYISKPLYRGEFIAKMERALGYYNNLKRDGDFAINLVHQVVIFRGSSVELTRMEMRILAGLEKSRHGSVIERCALESFVWMGAKIGARTIDVHIHHLRKKLKQIGIDICFVAGAGYTLSVPPPQNGREIGEPENRMDLTLY